MARKKEPKYKKIDLITRVVDMSCNGKSQPEILNWLMTEGDCAISFSYEVLREAKPIILDTLRDISKDRLETTIRELEQDIDFLNEHIEIMKEYAAEKTKYIFNIMNFARFYLPVVFKEINIGIYLDIDMICRKPFFHILKEYNFFKNDFNILSPLILNCREMGLDKIGFYGKAFNAGFMVWNLKKYREQHLIKKFRQLVKFHNENRIWKLGTQPILNILYYNKVIDINKNWNRRGFGRIITSEKEKKKYDKNSKSAFIIHWNSQYKPWNYNEVAAFEIWNKYSLTNNYSN